jgi:hypothetical protein
LDDEPVRHRYTRDAVQVGPPVLERPSPCRGPDRVQLGERLLVGRAGRGHYGADDHHHYARSQHVVGRVGDADVFEFAQGRTRRPDPLP